MNAEQHKQFGLLCDEIRDPALDEILMQISKISECPNVRFSLAASFAASFVTKAAHVFLKKGNPQIAIHRFSEILPSMAAESIENGGVSNRSVPITPLN